MDQKLANDELELKSKWLRRELFELFLQAKQGHPGSVLSQVEITVALYYGGVIQYKYGCPVDPDRDRLIISKGHSTMGLYPILADIGFFPKDELKKYGSGTGILRIFGNISIPGIDATSGSLGHGQGIGAGYALSAKKKGSLQRSYVIISEGEMYEGAVWETALFASHHKLDNLVWVLDRNHKIILGDTEDLLELEPIADKWSAFGWDVFSVNGHSIQELLEAFEKTKIHNGRPKIIIADTVKGKGISLMEHRPEWHYWQGMTEEDINNTRRELEVA